MKWTFDYGFTRVGDLRVLGQSRSSTGRVDVKTMDVNGEAVVPTRRFWKSFFMRFGVSDTIFRYFSPAEVFARISEQAKDDSLRYCLERNEAGKGRLLAISSPLRPVIREAEIVELASRYSCLESRYDEGIVTSTHTPRSGDQTFQIGGDRFQHRFVMETPVDGFSHPKIYLSFLRLICSNGMIGYSQAFRSDVSLGKDIAHCISRALETYDNGDGYAALRQRFESAQNSWASVHECVQLYKALVKLRDQKNLDGGRLIGDFHRMTGDLNTLYGLANLDALSTKRQRVLPARCRVYDLLNFASEIATHHSTTAGGRAMQAYIGTLISDEFDMEGTVETVSDFKDFFINEQAAAQNASLN